MKQLFTVARIVASVGILAYLFTRVELDAAYESLVGSDLRYLVSGTLVLAAQPIIGAVRWIVVLAALRQTQFLGRALRWNYIGVFFGQLLPATVGTDAIRVWLAGQSKPGWRIALVSVMLDRIVMLLVLLVLLLVGLPYISQMTGSPWVNYFVPLLTLSGFAGVACLALIDKLPIEYDRHRALKAVRYMAEGVRALLTAPLALICTLGISLLSYLGLMTSVFLFARAFGANSDFFETMILLPPVLVASMLPVSIGGWGTRELAMVAALGLVGISESSALLSSMWLGISSIVIALPGAYYFANQKATLNEMSNSEVLTEVQND